MATDTYRDTAPEEEQRKPPGPEVEAIDYAALNAVFGALLAGVVIAARQTDNARQDPITGAELIPISAADVRAREGDRAREDRLLGA